MDNAVEQIFTAIVSQQGYYIETFRRGNLESFTRPQSTYDLMAVLTTAVKLVLNPIHLDGVFNLAILWIASI